MMDWSRLLNSSVNPMHKHLCSTCGENLVSDGKLIYQRLKHQFYCVQCGVWGPYITDPFYSKQHKLLRILTPPTNTNQGNRKCQNH